MHDPLRAHLQPLFETLCQARPGSLTRLPPLDVGVVDSESLLVRALYAWGADEPAAEGWQHPCTQRFVELRGPVFAADDLRDAARNCQGGFVVLYDMSVPPPISAHRSARWIGVDPKLPAWKVERNEEFERLRTLSETWVMAAPPWREVRARLSRHLMRGEGILLLGDHGGGKCALVRGLHARLGSEADLIRVSDGVPPGHGCLPADWLLLEDVDEQGGDLRTYARETLRARQSVKPASSVRVTIGTRPAEPALAPLIGEDQAWCDNLHKAVRLSKGIETVLIVGESGTGKSALARAIHDMGPRAAGAFRHVDLGGPVQVVRAELFGSSSKAFTDVAARPGAFEEADGGTLFIDEIGNASVEVLRALLLVLDAAARRDSQGRFEVTREGGQRRKTSARLVFATNQDIEALEKAGKFPSDLLARLRNNATWLELPALRKRPRDIELIARACLGDTKISAAALEVLRRATWPGNVRGLQGALKVAAWKAQGGPIAAEHLDREIRRSAGQPGPVIFTAVSEASSAVTAGLPQPLVVLHMPPVSAGDRAAINLMLVDGRPIQPAALELLASHHAWCLADIARRARHLPAGRVVRREDVHDLWGDTSPAEAEPLVVLGSDPFGDSGEAPGRHIRAAGLVLGRLHTQADYQQWRMDYPAGAVWLDGCLNHTHPGLVALAVPLDSVSRVQVAVWRTSKGLRVQANPLSSIGVTVQALPSTTAAREASRPVDVGGGACIRIELGTGVSMAVYVFAGPRERVALHEQIHIGPVRSAHKTRQVAMSQTPVPPSSDVGGRNVAPKRLNAAEGAALGDLVLDFDGGEFKAWLRDAIEVCLADAPRVWTFLRRALDDNPGDRLAALLEVNPHVALAIARRFGELADGRQRLSRFPARIQRVLKQLLLEE